VIAGCSRRPIRFLIHRRFFESPVLGFVLRAAQLPDAANSQGLEQAVRDLRGDWT